ncbi:MAG: hypothetical protein E7006_02225 [Alphaproteobacteria bacterium]|nr:hypothetical protein [Alphaproteobacteria bacterium]
MEKYKVLNIELTENDEFTQWISLGGINQSAGKNTYMTICNKSGFFRPGDLIKRYCNNSGKRIAISYAMGRYFFVELDEMYVSKNLETFYDDVKFYDRINLKMDVARSLWSRGIKPALSATENLRRLIHKQQEKVR